MWKNLYVENAIGSEKGIIIRDEEYLNACWVTLEKCPKYYAITCGIYGAMVHTIFGNYESCKKEYELIKEDLQKFIDSNPDYDEIVKFCDRFREKYF